MKLDELIQELHTQADEAMTTAAISMPELRDRRARVRRRRVGSSAAAVALVVAVTWVAGSTASNSGNALEPSDTSPASTSPTRTPGPTGWTAVRCNRARFGGCTFPALLSYRGRLFADRMAGVQPVRAPNGLNLGLGLATGGAPGPRLMLVGATGTGPGSRLEVVVGGGSPRRISSGRPTALLITVPAPHKKVVVRETGTPGKGEALRVEGYTAQQ